MKIERSLARREFTEWSGGWTRKGPATVAWFMPSSTSMVRAIFALICLLHADFLMAQPPAMRREFRGLWVATVSNIDWPSRKGLPSSQQQAEAIAILDRAKSLRFNAIIFQVRPGYDALYKSDLEPWSEVLSGKQGVGPSPAYDPLEFWITESHKRGMELHAWFNPYRAFGQPGGKGQADNYILQRRPDLARNLGKNLYWLDPGEPEVRDHIQRVMLDVVKRYDVDGIHWDDYFYPYKSQMTAVAEFPDDAPWKRYKAGGGKLTRDDWRRNNVNSLVQTVGAAIRKANPAVRFGISPFGIWQPDHPKGVRGMNPYTDKFADSRRWLQEGWVDYMAPQLYWRLDSPQPFAPLLDWWIAQNTAAKAMWPGIMLTDPGSQKTSKPRPASEIANQLREIRKRPGSDGLAVFSTRALMEDKIGMRDVFAKAFTEQVLVPRARATPTRKIPPPTLSALRIAATGKAQVEVKSAGKPRFVVLRAKAGETWRRAIIGYAPSVELPDLFVKGARDITLSIVDENGNESAPATVPNS